MNKFFYFLLLIFLCFQTNIAQTNEGNKKIESFSKSKEILKKIHQESPVTFYCQCKYNDNKPNWESCGFSPKKDKKRASRIEWEHILPASHFGIKFDTWVNGHPNCIVKKEKSLRAGNVQKEYINYIDICKLTYTIFNQLSVKLMG